MLVLRNGETVPEALRGGVVAIGNFDGVHRGHKALIAEAIDVAADTNLDGRKRPAGVIIFEPHPSAFFRPDEPHFRLTPLPEKLRLLETLGLDFTVVLDFNAALSGMSAEQFVDEILVGRLCVSHVVIGYDFFYGRKHSGTAESMRDAGRAKGFETSIVRQQAEDGEVFSSTAIRLHLAQGDVAGAARLLGHWWRISGTVAGGNRVGRDLGFPTANIELPAGTSLKHGIYAVRVGVGGGDSAIGGEQPLQGAAYFGGRPTVDNGPVRLEVFILDFNGDIYGKDIAVDFIGFVREDQHFDQLDSMAEQMQRDCERVREILVTAPASPLAADAQGC